VNNSKEFACAELSLCPDICYAKGVYSVSNANLEDLKKHETNPCRNFSDGKCELSSTENKDFSLLQKGKINVSCECPKGFKYSTSMSACLEINECLGDNMCQADSAKACLNLVGSFICVCKQGFRFKDDESIRSLIQNYATELDDQFRGKVSKLECIPEEFL
jgi:hypothetical protein